MQVIRGAYNLVVMDDLPTWYFRLNERETTQAVQNEVAPGIQDAAFPPPAESNSYPRRGDAQPVIIGESDAQMWFGAAEDYLRKTSVNVPTRQFAIEGIVKLDATVPGRGPDNSGDEYYWFSHGDSTGGSGDVWKVGFNYLTTGAGASYTGMHLFIDITVSGSGNFRVYIQNPSNAAAYWTSAHLISISWDGTGQDGNQGWPLCYLDGVQVDVSSGAALAYSKACITAIGAGFGGVTKPYLGKLKQAGNTRDLWIGNNYTKLFGLWNGNIDEVAYWVNLIPKAGWAARHYAAFAYGAVTEDSGARMSHLLDQASVQGFNPWPSARRAIDTGISQVIQTRWNEDKLLDLIKQDAKSEGGLFFFNGRGYAVFLNRWHTVQYPYTYPKGTLTDHPNPAAQLAPYQDVGSGGLDYDDQDIYNDVRIARFSAGYGDASGQQRVIDATSQADFMIRTLDLDDSIVTTDEEALNAANWNLFLFKNPGLKAKSVGIMPLDDTFNLYRIVANTDLNDRLAIVRYPPPGTAAMNFDVLVMGIKHDIAPGEWVVNYDIYPAPPRDFWQLPTATTNDPYAQFSILGTTTRLSY